MDAEQRDNIRRTVRQGARLATTDGAALGTCIMLDVSATGARLKLDTPDPLPKKFVLLLSHNGDLRRLCSRGVAVGNNGRRSIHLQLR